MNASVEALLSAAEVLTDKPRSTRRTVQTQVTVNAGDTVIIGGLIAENAIENRKFIPVLSELPFGGLKNELCVTCVGCFRRTYFQNLA